MSGLMGAQAQAEFGCMGRRRVEPGLQYRGLQQHYRKITLDGPQLYDLLMSWATGQIYNRIYKAFKLEKS